MREELKNEKSNLFQLLGNHFRDAELKQLITDLDQMMNSNDYEDISKICVRNDKTSNRCV